MIHLSRQNRPGPVRCFGSLSRRLGPALALALWMISLPLQSDDDAVVRHELSFPQRHNQYVNVRASWPVSTDELELAMASWTPGSYLIRDFAANVEGLQAEDEKGRAREVRKTAKNRWLVDTAGAARLRLNYAVWAGELNVATSWIEASGALLNGAGVFLYSEDSRSQAQQVSLVLPGEWPDLQTALPGTADPLTFRARDFDELVDSPIVAGRLDREEFTVGGHPYSLVVPAGNTLWDSERARDDLAKIVEAHQAFWRVNPLQREYRFFNFFMGPFGGLEHDHSTVVMSSPWQMQERQDYVKWLGVVSHEFFHSWNVRRMRPSALVSYDYDREMYTRELWLAEGITSYYDDLLLFRSGLITVSEYLDLLAQEIRHYEVTPGRQVRSAQSASFDTWIKHYRPDENSVNSTVSYYRKGALIGFVTDTEIRRATDHRASLDTVMREMYARYGPGGSVAAGYPPGAFEAEVERVAGSKVRAFVEDLLQTTDDPDVDEALAWYGLRLDREPARTVAEVTGNNPSAGFGIVWDLSGERLLAEQVVLGHAGARAGILPGDELLAIDGFRVTPGSYAAHAQRLQAGQQVELTLSRHDRLLTLKVEVQASIPERYAIGTVENMRRREQQRLEAWLGRDLRFQ